MAGDRCAKWASALESSTSRINADRCGHLHYLRLAMSMEFSGSAGYSRTRPLTWTIYSSIHEDSSPLRRPKVEATVGLSDTEGVGAVVSTLGTTGASPLLNFASLLIPRFGRSLAACCATFSIVQGLPLLDARQHIFTINMLPPFSSLSAACTLPASSKPWTGVAYIYCR